MKPPPFIYHDPATVAEALDILAQSDNARLLAGGQSLMPMLNMRYVQPDHLIDLNRIPELAGIEDGGDTIRIGAMTRQRDLEFSDVIAARLPLMREALLNVGHRQTRNRGTIGGSLCHLDPAAELVAVAAAYDAVIEARNSVASRDIPMRAFAAGFMTRALEADEMLVAIRFTPWPRGHGGAFIEFSRRKGDFAVASAAVLLDIDGGTIRRAALCIGGLGPAPQRVPQAEALLRDRGPGPASFAAAAELCGALDADSDVHASAGYRRRLARVLTLRALTAAYGRATATGARS